VKFFLHELELVEVPLSLSQDVLWFLEFFAQENKKVHTGEKKGHLDSF
jgi:hypothetical protein